MTDFSDRRGRIEPSHHAPGLTSLGWVYINADGQSCLWECHSTTGQEAARQLMPEYVRSRLVQPEQIYTLPHMP